MVDWRNANGKTTPLTAQKQREGTDGRTGMIARVILALWLVMLATTALRAEEAPPKAETGVVLELFTSQGCAACPPADALFATFADREGVIALALHVDYWDYIGWRDRFARPEFTERQKDYARRAGRSTIYTPQMIVGGTDRVEGFRPMMVQDLLNKHAAAAPQVRLSVERQGDLLLILAEAEPPLDHEVSIQLVRYNPSERLRISAGENAGRETTYRNVVTAWAEVARWNGAGSVAYTNPINGDAPLVVILQEAGQGRIISAMRLR